MTGAPEMLSQTNYKRFKSVYLHWTHVRNTPVRLSLLACRPVCVCQWPRLGKYLFTINRLLIDRQPAKRTYMQSGWMDGLGKDGVSADSSHIVTKSPLGDDKSFDWSTFNWVVVRLHHSLHFTLANRPLNRLYDGTNFTNLEPVQSNLIIIILIPIRTPPHQLQDNQVVLVDIKLLRWWWVVDLLNFTFTWKSIKIIIIIRSISLANDCGQYLNWIFLLRWFLPSKEENLDRGDVLLLLLSWIKEFDCTWDVCVCVFMGRNFANFANVNRNGKIFVLIWFPF